MAAAIAETSPAGDSTRFIWLLAAKTLKAENGETMEKHLLLTRYDAGRAARGEMLSVEDVLEILSIPLIGIIPESPDVLRASNLGAPVSLSLIHLRPCRTITKVNSRWIAAQ